MSDRIPPMGLKHGYDFNELSKIIKSVVPDIYDSHILWLKVSKFIGFDCVPPNNSVDEQITEYDNIKTREEKRKTIIQ